MINKLQFQEYVNQGFNIIPLSKAISLDNASPLTIYSKVANKTNTFLLESVEGGEKWAQYSIIGIDCLDSIKVTGDVVETKINSIVSSFQSSDPLNEIRKLTSLHKAPEIENLPRFFGGYVGFFAYESAQYAEIRFADLIHKDSKFEEHMPEIYLVKAEKLIVYDNINKTTQIILNIDPLKTSYEKALRDIEDIGTILANDTTIPEIDFNEPSGNKIFNSNFSKEDYLKAVDRVKDYIEEGDVMQVVLAQDFFLPFQSNPFDLYKALRDLNPSPYMYYLDLEECQVVGASPEILIRLEEGKVTLRPIAGTRKRGKDDKRI